MTATQTQSRTELPPMTSVDLSKRPGVCFNPGGNTWNIPFEGVTGFIITDPKILFGIWSQKKTGTGDFADRVAKLESTATDQVRDYVRKYAKSQGKDPTIADLIVKVELKPSEPTLLFRKYAVIPWVDFTVTAKSKITAAQRQKLGDALFPLSYT